MESGLTRKIALLVDVCREAPETRAVGASREMLSGRANSLKVKASRQNASGRSWGVREHKTRQFIQ